MPPKTFPESAVQKARRGLKDAPKPPPRRLSAAEIILGELADDLMAKRNQTGEGEYGPWSNADMRNYLLMAGIDIPAKTIGYYLAKYEPESTPDSEPNPTSKRGEKLGGNGSKNPPNHGGMREDV